MRLFLLVISLLALSSCVGSSDWYYSRAMGEFNQGHLDKAVEYFSKSLEQNPRNAKSLYGIGWVYNIKGKHDDAFIFFRRCEAEAPNYYACHKGLASSYLAIGMLDKSEEELKSALALAPDNPSVLSNMADLEFSRGNFEQALRSYEKAIAKDPGNGELYYGLASTYIRLGDDDKALSYLEQGLRNHFKEKRFKAEMHFLILSVYLRKITKLIEPYKPNLVIPINSETKRALKNNLRQARDHIAMIRRFDPTRKGLRQYEQVLDQVERTYLGAV